MRCNVLAAALITALGTASMSAHAAPGDTTLGGKMFVDFTHIDQKDSGHTTDATGTGLDVKRFYFVVDHQFDDIWSADLTTDFNYVSSDGETNLFVKKAYVQGRFSKAAVFRAGSADQPWIPFVEGYYGYRYVENTLIDRLHYGNSADWGLHLGGTVGSSESLDYSVAVVNGGGYKHPDRSRNVDFEGRVGFSPISGMVLAVGGYSGKLGKDLPNTNTGNTAMRIDGLVAYAGKNVRLGAEYFQARDWGNVTTPYSDKADGYSLWGSVALSNTVSVFARYDHANLSKDIDPRAKDTYYNAGVQFRITKGIVLAAVFKHEQQNGNPNLAVPVSIPNGEHPDLRTNEIGVWGEVKF